MFRSFFLILFICFLQMFTPITQWSPDRLPLKVLVCPCKILSSSKCWELEVNQKISFKLHKIKSANTFWPGIINSTCTPTQNYSFDNYIFKVVEQHLKLFKLDNFTILTILRIWQFQQTFLFLIPIINQKTKPHLSAILKHIFSSLAYTCSHIVITKN